MGCQSDGFDKSMPREVGDTMAGALGSLDIADMWTNVGVIFDNPLISGVVLSLVALGLAFRIIRKVRGLSR